MPIIVTRTRNISSQDRKIRLRIKPVVILVALCFLFAFNCIVIYSYEHQFEIIHFNVLIYMYLNFWITFFLLAYQIKRITRNVKLGESKQT